MDLLSTTRFLGLYKLTPETESTHPLLVFPTAFCERHTQHFLVILPTINTNNYSGVFPYKEATKSSLEMVNRVADLLTWQWKWTPAVIFCLIH